MKTDTHSSYRPDIDGLRAVAVMAVIGFHASPRLIPGGFVGVDIFFVISGYLITGLIYKELESGTFRIGNFYTRRIKRLLPAYIVVSLCTLAFSSYLLIPNDYIFFTTSLAASWAFVANIFFSMLSWGYFGQRSEGFPLLHTWSLSVEEQFYFIFPLLLIFLFRYFKKYLVPICLVAGLVFVGISEVGTGKVGSYFLLPYRAHELLIGVLSYFALKENVARSRRLTTMLGLLGLLLILGSIFLLDRSMPFPGIRSLAPCLGAALLIYSGSRENMIRPIFTGRVMVFIGLLSYSLYLWHWPIFSFLNYRRIDITFSIGLAAISLSLFFAYLTWRFIETPIRRNKQISFKTALFQYYGVPAALFLAVGISSYATEGMPQRFSPELRQLISSYSFERDLTRACAIRADDYKKVTFDYLEKNCAFGEVEKFHPDILLFGDSHAHHFKPFVESLAKQAHLKAVYHVQGGCDSVESFDGSAAGPSTCERRNEELLNMAGRFKYVVLASTWSYKGKEKLFEEKMGIAIQKVVNAKVIPVVFKDNPYTNEDLSQCILFEKRGWANPGKNCSLALATVNEMHASMDNVIDSLKSRFPQMVVIDPKVVMCDKNTCATYIGNTALFKDANHLNTKAATLLGERYLEAGGNPFFAKTAGDSEKLLSLRHGGNFQANKSLR